MYTLSFCCTFFNRSMYYLMGFVEIHLHEFCITLQLMNAQHTGMLGKVISYKGNCIMYAF